jgi:hypothetical protein
LQLFGQATDLRYAEPHDQRDGAILRYQAGSSVGG